LIKAGVNENNIHEEAFDFRWDLKN
jgi:hypothetical protein